MSGLCGATGRAQMGKKGLPEPSSLADEHRASLTLKEPGQHVGQQWDNKTAD